MYTAKNKAPVRRFPSFGGVSGGAIGNTSYASARAQAAELPEDQVQEIREAFTLFDLDKDGSLTPSEFKVALRSLGFELNKGDANKLFQDNETSGSGRMGWDDFHRILSERIAARDPMEEIQRAFKLFDDEGTGRISLRSLKRVAKELGENLDDEELAAMIEEFDLDQDGAIDLREFTQIMLDDA
ncbi:Calcium-binding component of the spindle pole body (SPB) half-bridge [Malassezia cuniculi]|uniref:Calcium-binding component of the spindle pole body (SPB) half-bridge n=1 Tax=Malassezia cuniculi TaxID=948313 RepID=A0AAF0EWL0_9BASI|nr:Calcium-binding component of the spindle pole body (SPB) half-bridge [Malassezia cuniculi]